MKSALGLIKPFNKDTHCWNVIVETPKGSNVKYALDEKTGLLTVRKALPEGMVFPFNFGMIPGTVAEDGDPIDVLVFNEEPLVAGCLLQVKPIGVIKAAQTEGKKTTRNDRILGQAIPKESPTELEEIKITKKTVSQIAFFFKAYNKAYGKSFRVFGTGNAKKAVQLIKRAMKRAQKESK
ncbi:MAG TPA: inorganic diphosphatase [Verrucomicrobiae bacterium]|jgi:inorganic pyrophosphatase